MAQWLGQFSGHTHATRIADLEAQLRHAIAALSGPPTERAQRSKRIRALAGRLLSARIRLLRAKIAAADIAEQVGRRGPHEAASLRLQLSRVQAGGVRGVLAALGGSDAPEI